MDKNKIIAEKILNFPAAEHVEAYNKAQKNGSCSICLDFNITPTPLPSCNHYFCKKCVKKLIDIHEISCPICKDEIGL